MVRHGMEYEMNDLERFKEAWEDSLARTGR
jgi:hypothetical protein